MEDPFLVTLGLDDRAAARFEDERQTWFPAERNRVPAHLMLFHQLPGDRIDTISADVAAVTGDRAPFALAVTGLRSLGAGVAYVLESPQALAVRADLAGRWQTWLIAQDREGYRPHVVVQNKVTRAQALTTHAALVKAFVPFSATAIGVDLWRYRGGPWEFVSRFPYGGLTPADGDR